ncbi:IS66 family transposase [Parageobacillus thermoglucosidasius]|uniref:IS66 family transposase n=1 Tax=Parageobacillus thermoglucosidasius TaxID=1426 RepID=UPI00090765BD|nr:hypothetical protein DV712_03560 [Parageobacillus thermoglucosidasius]
MASPILHADETSLSVQGKRHWLHVAGTSEATWLFCHPKRGREAMEAIGLLPGIGEPSCTMHGRHIFCSPRRNTPCATPTCFASCGPCTKCIIRAGRDA